MERGKAIKLIALIVILLLVVALVAVVSVIFLTQGEDSASTSTQISIVSGERALS